MASGRPYLDRRGSPATRSLPGLRRRWTGILALALTVVSAPAWAGASARLVYSRTVDAASCPGESELRDAVMARFGYDPFSPWAKQAVIVQISRPRARYVARVQLLDEQGIAHGARELTSNQRECSEIFDAVALAIAIALDAAAKPPPPPEPADAPPPSPSPAPAAAATPPAPEVLPAPAPAVSAEVPPAPPSASAVGVSVDAGVEVLGSVGWVPALGPGVSAFARARRTMWSLSVELRADFPGSTARDLILGGGRVEAWLPAAGLVPCLHAKFVAVCAVGWLGSLQASGQEIDPKDSRTSLFAAAGARVAVEWPESTTYALRVHADGVANLNRARLILGQDEVWAAPLVAGTVGAGVVARFP